MYTILDTVKINNWNDVPEIKGIIFERYNFKEIPEIYNIHKGYGFSGYACKCGTTFLSHYGICPTCGNRHFTAGEMWDFAPNNDVCDATPYYYKMVYKNQAFSIIKKSGEPCDIADARINYKDVFAKYPVLFDIEKYKYMHDVSNLISDKTEMSAWWIARNLTNLVWRLTGKYDLDMAKTIIDMLSPNTLANFVAMYDAPNILAFVLTRKGNPELIKRIDIYDFAYNCDKLDKLPNEIIEAALKGHPERMIVVLEKAVEMIAKYGTDPLSIKMLSYYLENCTKQSLPKVELPIFMEWAMKTTEEVTMEKFYWYMNAKHIQRAGLNDKFEKILENFDNDPVTALIKLTKA